jgi:hypothetical protein
VPIAPAPEGVRVAALIRYNDRGASGFANLTLDSGERVFISLAASGLRVHRLIFFGRLPGRTLHVADAAAVRRAATVIARTIDALPPLPDSAAMDALLAKAITTLNAAAAGTIVGDGNAGATTLKVLTRAALAEPDAASFVRRLSRAAITP